MNRLPLSKNAPAAGLDPVSERAAPYRSLGRNKAASAGWFSQDYADRRRKALHQTPPDTYASNQSSITTVKMANNLVAGEEKLTPSDRLGDSIQWKKLLLYAMLSIGVLCSNLLGIRVPNHMTTDQPHKARTDIQRTVLTLPSRM